MRNNKTLVRNKAVFEQYTKFDMPIVKMASICGLYLIGGTAIDLLCNYYSVQFWRNRSDNDLDFWTSFDNQGRNKFIKHIKNNFGVDIEESSDFMVSLELSNAKIETDILIDRDCVNEKFTSSVNGINVMSPIYLFSSKFDRYINTSNALRKETDFKDLKVLLLETVLNLSFDPVKHNLYHC